MIFGEGGDLLGNFRFTSGRVGCHSGWDLKTTNSGDLAITKDDSENYRQRLVMWAATPLGERVDPTVGCCLHDYMHAKITGDLPRRIELDLYKELSVVFPELSIRNIRVQPGMRSGVSNREMLIDITLGDEEINFVADFNEMMKMNEELNEIIYYGGQV